MADRSAPYRDLTAPAADIFTTLISEVMSNLPSHFKAWVENIVIKVEDFPDDDMMVELGLESKYELLGLYHDPSLSTGEALIDADEPHIFLFRRAIIDYWAENDDSLGAIVAHVLIHEIAQHFNLAPEEATRIEELAMRTGGRALH